MAIATVGAPKPCKQKGRPVAGRPLTNFNNNDTYADNASALRMQRLRLLGIIGARAGVLASLAWGEVQNG